MLIPRTKVFVTDKSARLRSGSPICLIKPILYLTEWNSYETCQIALLYVFKHLTVHKVQ